MSHDHLSGQLTPEGHRLPVRVYFEDTDFSGRVYHARYLHFLERGRSDFLRLLGIHHNELAALGLAFAVRRMALEFLAPAAIDDVLLVETLPGSLSGARIRLAQSIRCNDRLVVAAKVEVALIGPDGRPRRLSPAIRDALLARKSSE
jgi:acyl-CoA thioester hydrolase